MTYNQFLSSLNGFSEKAQPKVKLYNGMILTLKEWENNLKNLCRVNLDTVMSGCEITLVF